MLRTQRRGAQRRGTQMSGAPMYLIIGSGIAGLSAALRLATLVGSEHVTLVTKGALADSNTRYAQGGIAAALGPGDSPSIHAEDTIAVGAGLNVADVVSIVCQQGADLVEQLEHIVDFDRNADGTLAFGLEAAHRAHRVLHAGGDATGRAIAEALIVELRKTDVRILEHTVVEALITCETLDGLAVCGARVFDAGVSNTPAGQSRDIDANAVLLATGGIGQIYEYTTNPDVATGDGIALAWRAGAAVADMEFVQFHPTSLNWQQHFLIDRTTPRALNHKGL